MKIITKLNTIENINIFNSLSQKCADEVEVGQDRWTVNGKSLMGLYSLNLSEYVIATFNGIKDREFINDLKSSNIKFDVLNT